MKAVSLSIDEHSISAPEGWTILEVARRHGIYIPTLCHHEALRPLGACRLCQVELADRGVVVPACVTQVADGMVVMTHSPRVVRNRRNILRLVMAAHPESCLVCEKGNTCELRKLAAEHGLGEHGLDPMPYHPAVQDLNPLLARDLSKCIMCQKCIRADQDLVVQGALDYRHRGFDAHPATLLGLPLEQSDCTLCGTCLTVCPTGAIFEKDRPRLDHGSWRAESVCPFCACGCALSLEHDRRRVVAVHPAQREPNGITLCLRGHFGYDHLSSRERLSTPLLRGEDGFTPISWDQALEIMARELGSLARGRTAAAGLGFIGGARASNEENYLFQKLARQVLGCPNLDSAARLGWAPAAEVLRRATGFAAGSAQLADLERTSLIFLVGADPSRSAPQVAYAARRALRAGTELWWLDCLAGGPAAWPGAQGLRVRPGGEGAALAGLIKLILEDGLVNHHFSGAKTRGLKRLERRFQEMAAGACARAAGVALAELRRAARRLAEAETLCLVAGEGVTGSPRAAELMELLLALALITGNLGRRGTGILPILPDSNSQGSLDMGVSPHLLPGHRPVGESAARRHLAELWGAAPPARPGLDYFHMMAAAAQGRLRGLYLLGEDPLSRLPGRESAAHALGKLEFLVVQDMFLTPTARLAHLVLPATGLAEKQGSLTSLERRVQRLEPAVDPPGGAMPEWRLLVELARRLGADWDYPSLAAVRQEMERAAPLYHGIDRQLRERGEASWPLPGNELISDTLPHGIGLAGGRAMLPVPRWKGEDDPLPRRRGYPYLLLVGPVLERWGTGARSGRSPRLARLAPEPWLGLAPRDFLRLGLEEGERLRVRSTDGSLVLPVRRDPRLPAGVVFLPSGFEEAPPGVLMGHDWRDGASPQWGRCRVSLRRMGNK